MNGTMHDSSDDGLWHVDFDTPIGSLRAVASGTAIVGLYHGHHEPAPKLDRLGLRSVIDGLASSSVTSGSGGEVGVIPPAPAAAVLLQAGRELKEYVTGCRRSFEVPLDLGGTPFQARVWAALEAIPYGERRSYRDIAEQLGNPSMGRAIGAAVRANPVSIVVPGHRVVSAAGAVVGYAAGTAIKAALLELEMRCLANLSPQP